MIIELKWEYVTDSENMNRKSNNINSWMHKNLEIRFYLKLKNKHLKSRLYNKQHQAKAAALGFAALFENCIIELFQHWN